MVSGTRTLKSIHLRAIMCRCSGEQTFAATNRLHLSENASDDNGSGKTHQRSLHGPVAQKVLNHDLVMYDKFKGPRSASEPIGHFVL